MIINDHHFVLYKKMIIISDDHYCWVLCVIFTIDHYVIYDATLCLILDDMTARENSNSAEGRSIY